MPVSPLSASRMHGVVGMVWRGGGGDGGTSADLSRVGEASRWMSASLSPVITPLLRYN